MAKLNPNITLAILIKIGRQAVKQYKTNQPTNQPLTDTKSIEAMKKEATIQELIEIGYRFKNKQLSKKLFS